LAALAALFEPGRPGFTFRPRFVMDYLPFRRGRDFLRRAFFSRSVEVE